MAFQKRVETDQVRNSFQGLAILFDQIEIIMPTFVRFSLPACRIRRSPLRGDNPNVKCEAR